MKIDIKILKPGTYTTEVPKNWLELTQDEKVIWATEYVNDLSDEEIINGMADFIVGQEPDGKKFDHIEIHSIEDNAEEINPWWHSEVWKLWAYGEDDYNDGVWDFIKTLEQMVEGFFKSRNWYSPLENKLIASDDLDSRFETDFLPMGNLHLRYVLYPNRISWCLQ